eukprot:280869_1
MELWYYTAIIKAVFSLITIIITLRICYIVLCDAKLLMDLCKSIKFVSICSAVCLSLATTTNFAGRLYMHIEDLTIPGGSNSFKTNICQSLYIMGTFFNGVGIVLLYLLFLYRMNAVYSLATFKFKIPSCTIIILYKLLIILLMLNISGVILLICYYYGIISVNLHKKWSLFSWISTECVHLFISTSLVYMFVSTLLRLFYIISYDMIRNQHQVPDTYGSLDNLGHVKFSDRQQSILNDVTKQGIISVTGIVSTQMYLATMAASIAASDHSNKQYRSVIFAILTCLFSLDCMMNSLCILMTFSTQKQLYLSICGNCDHQLQRMCVQRMKRRLWKQYEFSNQNRCNTYDSVEIELRESLQ